MKTGVYPGTFDPITNGHTDIIVRSLRVFDRVIVAVAPNPSKRPLFDVKERVEMVRLVTKDLPHVDVEAFDGLLVQYVSTHGAQAVIRGLRAMSDFEYEFQLASMNRHLIPEVETLFLTPAEQYGFISSSLVREISRLSGDVSAFVPAAVAKALQAEWQRNPA